MKLMLTNSLKLVEGLVLGLSVNEFLKLLLGTRRQHIAMILRQERPWRHLWSHISLGAVIWKRFKRVWPNESIVLIIPWVQKWHRWLINVSLVSWLILRSYLKPIVRRHLKKSLRLLINRSWRYFWWRGYRTVLCMWETLILEQGGLGLGWVNNDNRGLLLRLNHLKWLVTLQNNQRGSKATRSLENWVWTIAKH